MRLSDEHYSSATILRLIKLLMSLSENEKLRELALAASLDF